MPKRFITKTQGKIFTLREILRPSLTYVYVVYTWWGETMFLWNCSSNEPIVRTSYDR